MNIPPPPSTTAAADAHPADPLIARADEAVKAGPAAEHLQRGLQAAEQAWALLDAADAPRRRRAGMLLMHFRYRTGALGTTVDLGLELLPLLRAGGPRAELVDHLRMMALCAVDTHRFETAQQCAQEAHQQAVALDDPERISLATNTLGCFFERVGDPWQAERLLTQAIELGRPCADWRPLFGALNNLGAVLIGAFHLLRDAAPLDEARAPLERALPRVQEALVRARTLPDTFSLVFVLGNLGEILVHLGRSDEARAVLEEALAGAIAGGYGAQVHRIHTTLGELLLLEGRVAEARRALDQVRADVSLADQPNTLLRLNHTLWRVCSALGDNAAALHHLEQTLKLERQRTVTQLRAQSQLFVTRMEAEHARHEAQRQSARADTLEVDSRRDQLTGLGNRREVERRWPELLLHAQIGGTPLSVAMVDLDHFKQINDRHGHALGDAVLVQVAELMRNATRGADLVARVGGEEFLLLMPDTPPQRALEVCDRLRSRVAAHPWAELAPKLAVTLSVGLASTPPFDAQALTQQADAALYRAKQRGRNRIEAGG